MHAWNFAPVWANADLLALGLLNTLKVTGAALAFGVPLGLALALMRLSPRRALAWPAGAVIEQVITGFGRQPPASCVNFEAFRPGFVSQCSS